MKTLIDYCIFFISLQTSEIFVIYWVHEFIAQFENLTITSSSVCIKLKVCGSIAGSFSVTYFRHCLTTKGSKI